jgi:hypothetical protein
MKPEPKTQDSITKDSEISKEILENNDDLKPEEKEDNTRFGDWVIKGRAIDF